MMMMMMMIMITANCDLLYYRNRPPLIVPTGLPKPCGA